VPDKGSEFSSFITAFAVNVVEQEPPKPLLLAGGVVGGELLKKGMIKLMLVQIYLSGVFIKSIFPASSVGLSAFVSSKK